MLKRLLSISLALAVISAFTIPAFAGETPAAVAAPAPEKQAAVEKTIVKGKIEALDAKEKKVTIDGVSYTLSRRAAKAEVAVGDMVEAKIKNGAVKSIAKEPANQ
jgi:Cu/Ag efflux protein CusF